MPAPGLVNRLPDKFDLRVFDDPRQWTAGKEEPLLDEHELIDPEKGVRVTVDGQFLDDVARNGNARAAVKGQPVPFIIGHTEDGGPEKPVEGYYYPLRTAPDPSNPGRKILLGRPRIRPNKAALLEQYPRRSVELWVGRREIDPVARLGGTTPERDLGDTAILRYKRDAGGVHYRYAMEECDVNNMPPKHSYAADPNGGSDPNAQANGDNDLLNKVFESAQWKGLESKIDKVLGLMEGGGGEGEGMPGDEGMPGMDGGDFDDFGEGDMGGAGMPGAPGAGMPMGGAGMPMGGGGPESMMPGGRDPEARRFHEPPPVQFSHGGGYPSGTSGLIPGEPARMSRPSYSFAYDAWGNVVPVQVPAQQPQRRQSQQVDEKVRMQRQIDEMRVQLARSGAREIVQGLKGEGILIPDEAETTQELINVMTTVGQPGVDKFVANVRKNYARVQNDPTAGLPLYRYARDGEQGPVAPTSMQDVQRVAMLAQQQGIKFDEAMAAAQYGGKPPVGANGHAAGPARK